ncbi:MAG: hypothetical protein WB992_17870 [Bryobacteraceae bacterium]
MRSDVWSAAKESTVPEMARPPAVRQVSSDIAATFARAKNIEEIAKTVRTFLVFGSALGMAYFFSHMVHDLAGKTTSADIGIKLLGSITVSEALAWAVAAICGGVAYKTGRTNRSLAKRLSRMADIEREIDPNRSSSHLDSTGMPREEDE